MSKRANSPFLCTPIEERKGKRALGDHFPPLPLSVGARWQVVGGGGGYLHECRDFFPLVGGGVHPGGVVGAGVEEDEGALLGTLGGEGGRYWDARFDGWMGGGQVGYVCGTIVWYNEIWILNFIDIVDQFLCYVCIQSCDRSGMGPSHMMWRRGEKT